MHSKRLRASLTAAVATAGAVAFTVLGTAGAAVASPGSHTRIPYRSPASCFRVQERQSGAFSDNNDILYGRVVPGSVSVVATQGTSGDNPAVTTFGPGTGYTVTYTHYGAVATLQSPYAGSNDGFTTYYAVFRQVCFIPWWLHYRLVTLTSGAFSNNQNILFARNLIYGSVFVVATLGPPGYISPSVNGFMQYHGYTVNYPRFGAVVTLQPPFAGSNDGFTTYYTVVHIR